MIFTELDIKNALNSLIDCPPALPPKSNEAVNKTVFTEIMINRFTHYLNSLIQWNKAYNLTAITEKKSVLIRHLLDSLIVYPFINQSTVIDVGSGAGLPGLLLAIACPHTHFHLLDSANKRTRFMQQMVLEMQLTNVTVIHARVQDFKPEQGFDLVLSRAFATLSDMILWSKHLVKQNGLFLAMKGKCDSSELSALAKNAPDITIKQIYPLTIPDLNESRHLVIMQIKAEY